MNLITKAKLMASRRHSMKVRIVETGEVVSGDIRMLNGKGACFVGKSEIGVFNVRLDSNSKVIVFMPKCEDF